MMASEAQAQGPVHVPPQTRAAWRAYLEPVLLGVSLALFFGALVYVNVIWSCYPNDNDLDEMAWLSAHLSLSRPESLANQGYPPGLPVVLRLLTPLVGSFLRATFFWQSIAATASVFFVYRISTELSRRRMTGPFAFLCAALAGLPVFTSEFADGTSTALFLGGLWLLTRRSADRRGFFLFGLGAGLSYLFRTHYLMMIVLVPASLVLAGFVWREAGRAALAFVSGFAATAWPLWLLNSLAYGTPLHAGVSQYNIAYAVIKKSLNWEDYPNTYQRWPLSRILEERPLDLVHNSLHQFVGTLAFPLSLAAAGLGAFAMVLAPDRLRRQLLAFGGLIALLYVGVVIVPTRYTERAYAPVAMLCSVLVACGVGELIALSRRPLVASLGVALGVYLLNFPVGIWSRLESRAQDAQYNINLSTLLVANGMQSSGEVFSNVWSLYNMADPQFITFYNYGGWIELDSLYAAERPHPTAVTVAEWKEFFAAHGIRFAVLRQRPQTQDIFRHPPPEWKELFSDKTVTVWAIPSVSEPQPKELAP
jgi:hypothetical protein